MLSTRFPKMYLLSSTCSRTRESAGGFIKRINLIRASKGSLGSISRMVLMITFESTSAYLNFNVTAFDI